MSADEPRKRDPALRSELVRLAWAAAFFAVALAVFVALFAFGLFH